MGKYETAVQQLTWTYFDSIKSVETVEISARVLDFISESHPELSLKDVLNIMEDAKEILLQALKF